MSQYHRRAKIGSEPALDWTVVDQFSIFKCKLVEQLETIREQQGEEQELRGSACVRSFGT